jgi:hypothetical protein
MWLHRHATLFHKEFAQHAGQPITTGLMHAIQDKVFTKDLILLKRQWSDKSTLPAALCRAMGLSGGFYLWMVKNRVILPGGKVPKKRYIHRHGAAPEPEPSISDLMERFAAPPPVYPEDMAFSAEDLIAAENDNPDEPPGESRAAAEFLAIAGAKFWESYKPGLSGEETFKKMIMANLPTTRAGSTSVMACKPAIPTVRVTLFGFQSLQYDRIKVLVAKDYPESLVRIVYTIPDPKGSLHAHQLSDINVLCHVQGALVARVKNWAKERGLRVRVFNNTGSSSSTASAISEEIAGRCRVRPLQAV